MKNLGTPFQVAQLLAKSTDYGLVYLFPKGFNDEVHQNLLYIRDVCRDTWQFNGISVLGERQYISVLSHKEAKSIVNAAGFPGIEAYYFNNKGDVVLSNCPMDKEPNFR